jgi:Ca2+-binding RTX toxin-like protein
MRKVTLLLAAMMVALTAFSGVALAKAFTGTNGNDKIVGTNSGDSISGGGGNDFLAGRGGNDRMDGGTGRDDMRGGAGNDYLNAADNGADLVNCGPGMDDFTVVDEKDFNRDFVTIITTCEDGALVGENDSAPKSAEEARQMVASGELEPLD